MLPLGHIGVAALSSHYARAPVLFAAVAALLPDAVDKGFFLLGVSPSTRWVGHTLLFAAAIAALSFIAFRRAPVALAVVFGFGTHLFLDGQHFLPLLYPLVQYAWPASSIEVTFSPLSFAFEAYGLAALMFACRPYMKGLRL